MSCLRLIIVVSKIDCAKTAWNVKLRQCINTPCCTGSLSSKYVAYATACVYFTITPELVQKSAKALSQPFSTLFNYILDHATVLSQWKLGEISPVNKKDCNLTKSNYRPISILPSLSKVFERLIHYRVAPYFEDLYHKLVFAYRKGHGCDTALLSLTEQWRKELDNRKIVGLVSMDLSKAFDMLPHSLIIQKLVKYGADDNTLSLIKDYLTDRKQRVKLPGTFSPWLPVQRGIPQGSILGPLYCSTYL